MLNDLKAAPNKRAKLTHSRGSAKGSNGIALAKDKDKKKGKDHAYDRATISIPTLNDEAASDIELSDEDVQFFSEHAAAATGFAQNLDFNGIQRCAAMSILAQISSFHAGARKKLCACIS